jgi:signal transduction histidine kinase/ligand-binding sensor domain-containing protein/DNA-binding response OmpR family regulator
MIRAGQKIIMIIMKGFQGISLFIRIKNVVLLLAFFFCLSTLSASDLSLNFSNLSLKDGLQNLNIKAILQDHQGFLWIGTEDGLHKYDGYNFRVYYNDIDDKSSIKNNNINGIIEDESKKLWIGTDRGLELYDRSNDSFIHIPIVDSLFEGKLQEYPHITEYYIENIYKDLNNNIFIGTRHHKLYRLDTLNNCIVPFCSDIFFEENLVQASDEYGNIWVSSSKGAYKFNTHTKELVHHTHEAGNSNSIASNMVFCIYVDVRNDVWIATDKGLCRIDGKTQRMYHYTNDVERHRIIPDYFMTAIYEDSLYNLWFCTENGLFLYDSENDLFTPYFSDNDNKSSISTNRLNCVFVDRQQILWVGTQTSGIDFAPLNDPYHFENVQMKSLLETTQEVNVVTEILTDQDGNIWMGTNGTGLHVINRETGLNKSFYHDPQNPKSIGTNTVLAIAEDLNGDLWFGGYYGGISRFRKKSNTFETISISSNSPEKIKNLTNEIKDMVVAGPEELLIATNGGGLVLYHIVNKTFQFILNDPGNPNSLCSNWCTSLLKDQEGVFWIGTYRGLSRWDRASNTFTTYFYGAGMGKSLAAYAINALFEDSQQNIWIGTPNGLSMLDKKTEIIKNYTRKSGLTNANIHNIIEDNQGLLWVNTNHGISMLNPKNGKLKNFNLGMQFRQFINGSSFKDKDGTLYFGSIGGFTRFHPDEIEEDNLNVPLYITDVHLFNQPFSPEVQGKRISTGKTDQKKIVLKHWQSYFTFKYVALNYLYPSQMQYAYILEGFDTDWRYVGTERSATYTNLPPGEYVFKVKAGNKNGVWSSFATSSTLLIQPPIWQTGWAYLVYLFLFTGAVFGTYKFFKFKSNMERQMEMERIKAEEQHKIDLFKLQFFTNISHELRTPLTLILGPTERIIHNIKHKIDPDLSLADIIYRNSLRLLRLVNQLLDFQKLDSGKEMLNLRQGNIVEFTRNICELFRQQAEYKKIQFNIDVKTSKIVTCFDPEKVERIISNLLSNAIKFTGANGLVTLILEEVDGGEEVALYDSFSADTKYVKITVSDNGVGIANSEKMNVFDSFYQAPNAMFRKEEGSGIGLSMTKDYVSMHGGVIVVKDNFSQNKKMAQGTMFVVYLPVKTSDFDAQPCQDIDLKRHHSNPEWIKPELPGTVVDKDTSDDPTEELPFLLIVEDNEDMRHYIRNELSGQFQMIEATSGKEGVRKATENVPDLIISDVMMPDITGIELCKEVKTNLVTSHIPVILLTALSENEFKIEGLETGADDFIVKPFNTEILKARIKNLIELRKRLQEKYQLSVGFGNKAAANNKTDQKFIERLFEIIEKDMDNPKFDVALFTKELGMSKTQLYKKIKAITGQSLLEFINTTRLKKAAEILLNEDVTVSEVAHKVGFSSLSVFTRSFTRQFKINPSKYALLFNSSKRNSNNKT